MTILPCKHEPKGGSFSCAQSGCQTCLENLILANEGLVHTYVQRQVIGGMVYADLVQEGRIALWRAVLKYDPQQGAAFSTYAWAAIRNQVWASIRYANQSYLWVEEEEPWLQISEVAETAYLKAAIQIAMLVAVARLPERLRAVIVWVYGLDGQPPQTMADLGREWGLTRERIRQLRNDALVLLRLPAYSAELRVLRDQASRAAYRQALRLNHDWLGRRRGL
jgi:RNA polymerase sigma factor (sigma-70 family)